jgi:hypothetical protein
MTNITDKVKDKLKDAKDKVTSTTKEGAGGTTYQRAKDPTQEYDEKEPMSPAKIKQHEPTAVRRDPSEVNIVEPGKESTSSQDAAEKARRSGMTKGTAGAAESNK